MSLTSDEVLPPPGDEIHVHSLGPAAFAEPALLDACAPLLDEGERARLARFALPSGKRQQLLTRALVRTVLSRYAPVDPRRWSFGENAWGRPHLTGPHSAPVQFNLSHTDGYITCAVAAPDCEVGVDVERASARELLDIADRFFAPAEVAALFALPAAAQPSRFFDYWTLKESYIKARGMGLAIPLDQFWFDFDPLRISFHPALGDTPAGWRHFLFRPTPDHRLALSARRPSGADLAVRLWEVTPDDLLRRVV